MVFKDTLNRYFQEIKVNCWGVSAKLLRITYESAVKSGNLISVILLLTSRNVVCVSWSSLFESLWICDSCFSLYVERLGRIEL